MSDAYRTRREQIDAFLAEALRASRVPANESALRRRLRRHMAAALKDAAMVGAAEERHRTLDLIFEPGMTLSGLTQAIIARPVLDVLGYKEPVR